MTQKAILFLNGDRSELPLIDDNSQIYCTDGAYDYLNSQNIAVSGVIGDFDSVCCDVPDDLAIHRYDQDYTDFEKALVYLRDKCFDIIDVYFASGGEMDHFLNNLSVAKKFYDVLNINFFDDYQRYFLANDEVKISQVKNKIVSIIPFPTAVVSSIGLVYEMKDYSIQLGDKTSCRNKAESDEIIISVSSGFVVIHVSNKADDCFCL